MKYGSWKERGVLESGRVKYDSAQRDKGWNSLKRCRVSKVRQRPCGVQLTSSRGLAKTPIPQQMVWRVAGEAFPS